jgi:hypothetical protein
LEFLPCGGFPKPPKPESRLETAEGGCPPGNSPVCGDDEDVDEGTSLDAIVSAPDGLPLLLESSMFLLPKLCGVLDMVYWLMFGRCREENDVAGHHDVL